MAHPTATATERDIVAALRCQLDTDAAIRLLDEAAAMHSATERRSLASRACRLRRAELAIYVDTYRERNGVDLNLERVCLEDEVLVELLLLATA